jgi:hypothetical protein
MINTRTVALSNRRGGGGVGTKNRNGHVRMPLINTGQNWKANKKWDSCKTGFNFFGPIRIKIKFVRNIYRRYPRPNFIEYRFEDERKGTTYTILPKYYNLQRLFQYSQYRKATTICVLQAFHLCYDVAHTLRTACVPKSQKLRVKTQQIKQSTF